MNNLSIREKIYQMFILGFEGTTAAEENLNLKRAIKNGLGGIILFSKNIISYAQSHDLVLSLQKSSEMPLFVSIDQEGGKVERTINVKNKYIYQSPMILAKGKNIGKIGEQTQIMSEELGFIGVNMNFAPVLDVNTNPKNPIIGERSFGNTPEEVILYSETVYRTFKENKIIAVGKHFPGHGDTSVDSHIDLPVVDLGFEELERLHISPFKKAIENGIDALMIAHVFYKNWKVNQKNTASMQASKSAQPPFSLSTPASLSSSIITDYLKGELGFKGLVVSDDMVMGGVTKDYSPLEACIAGINAGIDVFIYRHSDDETLNLIENLVKACENGEISEAKVTASAEKIIALKKQYEIIKSTF